MKTVWMGLLLLAGSTVNAVVAAQSQDIEEIVVTASLRDGETLDDVPAAITVLDETALRRPGQQHFQEVMEHVPNLNWSSASNRPRFFQLRGIGERSQYEGAPNPSVGFVVDDMDFSGLGLVGTLFDTQQVEVLRGPQGTRYGANALAGLIYIRTREPVAEPEFLVEATAGSESTRGLGVVAGGGLNDSGTAAWRLAVQQYNSDGFRFNDFSNRDDTNERDELTTRFRLRWAPSERLQFDATLLHADVDNGFDTFAPENTLTMHTDDPGRDAQRSTGAALRARWLGEQLELVSITSAARSDVLYAFDGDWGNDDYWGPFAPYDFTSRTDRERKTISQELRLLGSLSAQTRWIAGLYVQRLEEDNRFNDFFNGFVFRDLTSEFDADTAALFGEMSFDLTPRDVLTAGLRVERRDATYRDGNGLDLKPADTMAGGQLSWNRSLSDRRSAYLTLARGYKAGGFNLGLSVPDERRQFDPESLLNLELGLRASSASGRLRGAVALFYMRRDDMQVETSFQADPTDPLTFVFFTDNAASGTNLGLELEGSVDLSEHWSLFGSVGLLDTELKNFETVERDLSGRDQAHAPNWQVLLGTRFESARGWFGQVEVSGQDGFYFSDSHDQRSSSHALVNASAGYRADRWQLSAWGRNVFDRSYATRGFFFGLEPPDFPNRLYTQAGDPALFGLTFEWQY